MGWSEAGKIFIFHSHDIQHILYLVILYGDITLDCPYTHTLTHTHTCTHCTRAHTHTHTHMHTHSVLHGSLTPRTSRWKQTALSPTKINPTVLFLKLKETISSSRDREKEQKIAQQKKSFAASWKCADRWSTSISFTTTVCTSWRAWKCGDSR